MVTMVGRRGNLLICCDCGVPVENLQGQLQHRQRLYAALALISLTLVGGMIFLLAAMDDRLAPWATQTGQSEGGTQSGDERQRLPEPALLAPDPKPTAAISRPALPINSVNPKSVNAKTVNKKSANEKSVNPKSVSAKSVSEFGFGKQDPSTLPLPLPHRTQPGDHRPEPEQQQHTGAQPTADRP
jgi:hypothetical protein